MKEIELKDGLKLLLDDDDFEKYKDTVWFLRQKCNTYYAARSIKVDGKWKHAYIHHYIMPVSKGIEVDHIDGNGLNNTKANLRYCTKAQNQHNRRKSRGRSQYKGVVFQKKNGYWLSVIKVFTKAMSLGLYLTEIEAARAYDYAACKYFGEFAKLNFQEGSFKPPQAKIYPNKIRSTYVGVAPAGYGKWETRFSINGRIQKVALFDTPEEAAREYDRLARERWGEFAAINFPDDYAVYYQHPTITARCA